MTRYELATSLSSRLYMLTESERHSIIDRYVNEINEKIEEGIEENFAVEQLGDIDLLADRILARHHIDISRIAPNIQPEESKERSDASTVSETISEVAGAIKESAGKAGDFVKDTASKAQDLAKDTTDKAVLTTKKTAGVMGSFITWLGKGAEKLTLNLLTLCLFVFIWLPCMAVTALGVVSTVAAAIIYMFTGIGFIGVCIAGFGCCVTGIVFCLWLGNVITGGSKNE
ncbi:MAG: hypothetical protein IJD80_04435 [Oscillospiraceae bacterium]|nr:hypothetical protein [Oscillospiraceae bacterium]